MQHPYLRRPFWLGTVIALVLAAVLIAYLNRQYTAEQEKLTLQLYRQVCESTATLLVERLRHRFGAVVRDTIERIDHEAIAQYQLAAVAPQLAAGLLEHPFIERFFLWSYQAPSPLRDQVLFFRQEASGGVDEITVANSKDRQPWAFFADQEQGPAIVTAASDPKHGGVTFIAEQLVFRGVPHQVIIHQFGMPPPMRMVRGLIGYTVNLSTMRQRIGREILPEALKATVPQAFPDLSFTVLDEGGGLVYGSHPRTGVATASAALDLSFFSEDIAMVFITDRLDAPQWRLVVSSESTEDLPVRRQYLFAAIIVLIAIALVCAVTVHQQSTRLSEMHSEFISNVSHQLRTPLSLLLATTETLRLQRVRTPDKISEYARRLENQAARLARLVDQILKFSRVQAGLGVYEFGRVDLVALVRSAFTRFDTPHSESLLSMKVDEPGHDVSVDADSAALEEMLVNLLENAFKYSEGRTEVIVTVKRFENEALISVRDHGIGIDPADLPHVFDRFYRGRATGRQSQGFGLGLAIVSDIVRAHGGRATVNSMLGVGSEFRVYLPVAVKRLRDSDAAAGADSGI